MNYLIIGQSEKARNMAKELAGDNSYSELTEYQSMIGRMLNGTIFVWSNKQNTDKFKSYIRDLSIRFDEKPFVFVVEEL